MRHIILEADVVFAWVFAEGVVFAQVLFEVGSPVLLVEPPGKQVADSEVVHLV